MRTRILQMEQMLSSNRGICYTLFLFTSVLFLSFYSFSTSPLFYNEGMDSAVFKTMGLAILHGKVPYVDVFDHKGPVLYFINALGQWLIPGRGGIFALQVVGMTVMLGCWFRMAKLFVRPVQALLAILCALFLYGGLIQEGNQCEEWMMIFFSISLSVVISHYKVSPYQPLPFGTSMVLGLCFGLTFLIRPNDAVAQVGGIMTWLSVQMLYKEEFRNFWRNTIGFLMGTIVVLVPVVIYFAHHGALYDLWYGLIGFNQSYSGGLAAMITFSFKVSLWLFMISMGCLMIHVGLRNILMLTLIPMCLTILLMGKNGFPHYGIVLMPYYMLAITMLMRRTEKTFFVLVLSVLLFAPQVGNRHVLALAGKNVVKIVRLCWKGQDSIKEYYDASTKLLEHIPSEERGQVWNYDLRWDSGNVTDPAAFSVLWHNGIVQCNKITYGCNPKLLEEDKLELHTPRWVLVSNAEHFESDGNRVSVYDKTGEMKTSHGNLYLYKRRMN
ncbi:MAG: hypothetical protein ACI36X_08200 [Bacteroidaceae bacterium]